MNPFAFSSSSCSSDNDTVMLLADIKSMIKNCMFAKKEEKVNKKRFVAVHEPHK